MICYHGCPISGTNLVAAKVLARRDAMVSFYSRSQMDIAAEVCRSVVIDNGAFSAWRSGKPVKDWVPYWDFCQWWLRHPAVQWCVIPDEIDGDERDNDALIDWWQMLGLPGVPVWHLHESLDRLARLSHEFELVALGSSGEYAKVSSDIWWKRMRQAMLTVCDDQGRPRCNLHGLRMLDPTVLAHLPLSSADSTNVGRNIGLDSRWGGPYAPKSREVRAAVIMDRIESHATASRWLDTKGQELNYELLDCNAFSDEVEEQKGAQP